MIYGSVCSGIEAATQAWHPLGWKPAFFSEIEKFPSAVLAHHYPTVPNHGDMTKFKDWPDHAIDLLVGGTPCQSFSVAGLRKGLADPRGNLMLTFGAVARRYRPNWIVWENVPGVLSSDGGRDFGTFLGMLAELGYGFAYRVLDAQYVRTCRHAWAVPQRRRRVFVVGYLGDWRRAAAVLFDGESLSGNPPPRRETGKGTAPSIGDRIAGGGTRISAADVAPTLNAHFGEKQGLENQHINGGGLFVAPVSLCLNAGGMGRIDAESETLIPTIGGAFDVARTLTGEGYDASYTGTGGGTPLVPVAYRTAGDGNVYEEGDVTAPLTTATDPNAQVVAFDLRGREGGAMPEGPHDTANIRAASGGSSRSYVAQVSVSKGNETLYPIGIKQGCKHASTSETNPRALLSGVREALGEEAFAEWVFGILDTLQSSEVLRSALHGHELRPAAFSKSWVVHCALSRPEDRGAGAVRSMREAGRAGCASQGWQPSEQRSVELGAYLSGLSQPGAQAERFMFDLWEATEGLGVLRQALSAVQKARRPARSEDQSAHSDWAVRRLTADECEFLQGMPRGYTRIPYRGKPAEQCPDGPRHKALGNSMAVNVMTWLGERIAKVDAIAAQCGGIAR